MNRIVFTSLQSAPSSGPTVLAQEILVLLGQTNGRYVGHVMYRSIQSKNGHVESEKSGKKIFSFRPITIP